MNEKFSYFGSIIGLVMILLSEAFILWTMPQIGYTGRDIVLLFLTFIGASSILILSKEVIFEYNDSFTILGMFMATIIQFITFFAFQYWFLLLISPGSFSDFIISPANLFLQSTLVFLFNPTIVPETEVARLLITINLLGAIVIILFIFQNIWHFKEHKNG